MESTRSWKRRKGSRGEGRSTVLKIRVAACVWLLKMMCGGDTGRIMGHLPVLSCYNEWTGSELLFSTSSDILGVSG